MTAFVYIVECADGSLYTGWTTDVHRRICEHNAGRGGRYTRSRLPVRLVFVEAHPTPSAARRREAAIKQLARAAKQRLIQTDRGPQTADHQPGRDGRSAMGMSAARSEITRKQPMSEQWSKDYITLAFRIDKVFRREAHNWFVDSYFGPPEWKTAIEAEPEASPEQLIRDAIALADSLPAQNFAPERTAYLQKQVRAMETICRKLNGERFALEDEVERCLDVRPEWVPETQLEQALALCDQALPGTGSLRDRYHAWRRRHEFIPERPEILADMMRRTLEEARRRTLTFVDLPESEGVDVAPVTDKPWGAANWYLGNYRSRIELNTDLAVNVAGLLSLMCHEGYPGHHTEMILKDKLLYRERGYDEFCIFLAMTPQLIIAEGIATLALQMIFGPGEAQQWATEQLYPQAGVEADMGVDFDTVREGTDMLLAGSGNAVFMVREGRSDDEVLGYLMRYSLESAERLRKFLSWLKLPYMQPYTFSYSCGAQLMRPLLRGPDRMSIFRRFLTEPVSPSILREWASFPGGPPGQA